MIRLYILICAMATFVMSHAEGFSYKFYDTPLPKALIQIMDSHPELDINFIYNELENYSTSATVSADNAYDAIRQTIDLNPVIVVTTNGTYYVEALQHGKYVYTGRAVGADNEPVAAATVMLLAPRDSTILTYGITDAEGRFSIPCDRRKVIAQLSCIGYQTSYQTFDTFDVGTIMLAEQTVRLGEIKVETNSIIESKGMTIVYPSPSDVKASSTAISLLQKLPLAGLSANPINRSLSVDGGTPVIIINGVPSNINDFNAIQPKNIAKIEFSRITPARYADRGNTGLLNITLKQRTDGGQVYLWGRTAVATAFVDGNLQASYHQGPSRFTMSYNPSWRNYQDVFDTAEESYISRDFRVNLKSHDRSPFYYHVHQIGLKYDYSPDEHTLFSSTFRMTPFFDKRRSIAHTEDSYLGEYDNKNMSRSKDLTPSLDLFFKREFNDRNALEVQVVGTLSVNDYRRSNQYFLSDGTISDYVMDVDSRRRSLISEVSYKHQFGSKTSLSAGYQNTLSHSKNTYLSTDYEPILTENNNYAYAHLGQQIGPVYLSVATGAKMYWIKNDLNKRHFIRNLTTAQLAWNISRNWSVKASFQYTPIIPTLSALTDNPQQQTPYLISNGNPDLKVSNRFIYQVSPSFRYKKFSSSMNMYYRSVGDFVMDDMMYLGDRMFLSQSVNAKRSWCTGASLNLRLSDIYGFGVNADGAIAHYETLVGERCRELTSFSASISLWWNHGPYTISYWRKFPGKYLNGNYVGKDENGDSLSFEFKPDKHWVLGASWMYMFDPKGTKYPSWSYSNVNPFTKDRYIKNNGNMIVLSLSYSADFGSIFRASRRTLNNTDSGSSLLKM